MKRLIALIAAMAAGLVIFFLWLNRLPPFDGLPEATPVAFSALSDDYDGVRVSGTAHLTVKQRLVRPARLGRPESTWWLYPLFAKGDTGGTLIRAMVLSPYEPDRLTGLEDMTVDAWARPPSTFMTPAAEDALRERGYSFAEDYVLLEVFPPAD